MSGKEAPANTASATCFFGEVKPHVDLRAVHVQVQRLCGSSSTAEHDGPHVASATHNSGGLG